MAKDYVAMSKELTGYMGKLHKALPEAMTGFSGLVKGATHDGVLPEKTKEMMSMAIAVAKQCDGCIALHMQKLVRLGITEAELMETLGVAIVMGGGPSLMYAAEAVRAFEQFSN